MLDHKFKHPERNGSSFQTRYKSDLKPTSKIDERDIKAVQKRFIECFIRTRPTLPAHALPTSGNFTLKHMIVGLYKQIIRILFKYTPEDFNSPYLYLYPLSSLCKNLHLMNADLHSPLKKLLHDLMDRYEFSEIQKLTCMSYLDVKQECHEFAQENEWLGLQSVEMFLRKFTVNQVER